ncbi:MAG TPA: hypothetical protein VK983_04640, partial [Candidatus Limnocylindrales bacterium]|nr:hypothetical protein [Candidatus Limnocylindrales bacterium]
YASISYSGNTAVFAASAGVTRLGSGSGTINMKLSAEADKLNIVKTFSPAAAYSTNDFNFTRTLTAGANNISGSLLNLTDNSTTTGANSTVMARFNQTASAATGNLLELQKAGANQFAVSANGAITAAVTGNTINGLVINGGSLSSVGNITGAGALTLASGSTATLLTLQSGTGTAKISLDSTANTITLGVSDTIGVLLVLDTKTDAGDPTGSNGAMYYNSSTGKFRCYEGDAWKNCIGGEVYIHKTADQGHAATSFVDITDLGWPVVANGNYRFECNIFYQAGATTNCWLVSATAPATPNLFVGQTFGATSVTATGGSQWNVNDGGSVTATSATTTPGNGIKVTGLLRNGATAGTLQLRFRNEVATSTHTIKQGSYCSYNAF